MEFAHIPVMLTEAVDALRIRQDGAYLDGTLGGAGHSTEIAKRLGQDGRLYGFDLDTDALAEAKKRLSPYENRVTLFHDNFKHAVERLTAEGVKGLDGILLDLGVSGFQIDNAARGFSYMQDAPLDMRMNREQALTAREIVNTHSAEELTQIFSEYGEERFAKRIAERIVKERETGEIATTAALNDIIYAAVPKEMRTKHSHPSKRVFQALRIACNGELTGLAESLDGMIDFLKPGGRICVITFHSLEDRIVKTRFKNAEHPCICPPQFPVCTCGKVPKGRVITRKALSPGAEEIRENARAKSAKLRVFERQGRN